MDALRARIVAFRKDTQFLALLTIAVAAIIVFHDQPAIAMWIGFGLAGYSAIANDSIQTLGTFLSSNHRTRWWILWLFIGGIMAAVFTYGWLTNGGDISYDRLNRIPEPTSFTFLQLLAPLVLLVLTRLRMPVSTTFLLLSVFSSSKTIGAMIEKTAIGYLVAFAVAFLFFGLVAWLKRRNILFHYDYDRRKWRVFQWAATGFLWAAWLMQDTANIAVFLPRSLSDAQFGAVLVSLFALVGLLMYFRGGRIQRIVTEKTDVIDPRPASLIDLVLASLLIFFKEINDLPMSTTWVFLGLLAGREIALTHMSEKKKPYQRTLRLVIKDISLATVGLLVSLLIALLAGGL